MDEGFLAVAYIHESRVQCGEQLLDSAKIYVSHRTYVTLG